MMSWKLIHFPNKKKKIELIKEEVKLQNLMLFRGLKVSMVEDCNVQNLMSLIFEDAVSTKLNSFTLSVSYWNLTTASVFSWDV